MKPAPGGSGRPERAVSRGRAAPHAALAFLILAWNLGPAFGSPAAAPDAAVLLARADERALSDDPRWRALLHYEWRTFPPGHRSAAASPAFFLAPDGARDARAELAATLRGLLDPAARSARDEPVACSFPARAAFLTRELGLDADAFPRPACPEFAAWRAALQPTGLTVVFPEAFMNSPASMFGHTLLRLDESRDDEARNLLGHAIDFTADAGGEAGPIYLLKGVFGRYPARFGLNPFWEKLKQYADWQNRDLWEYRLDLTDEEIELVLLHLWELREVDFPYYFFDENCSYHLVRLLQVARPEIEVSHGFPVSVIPIDTVRDVIRPVGTTGEARYRPSPASTIRHALRELPRDQADAVFALTDGTLAPDAPALAALPAERRARLLALAYDTLRFRFLDDDVPQDDARRRAHRLLLARSRLGEVPDVPAPRPAIRPDQGHGTAMFSIAGGIEDDRPFFDLRLRPALHGRLDPGGGHSPDSSIRVLDTTLRYYPALGRVRLHELVALELRSESPWDRLGRPLSWHASTGLRTRMRPRSDGDLDAEPVWRSEGGLGLSVARGDWLRAHFFAELRAETGGSLEGNAAFGPGLAARLALGTPASRLRLQLGARAHRLLLGDTATVLEASLEPTLRLNSRLALVSGVRVQRDERRNWLEGRLELRVYF